MTGAEFELLPARREELRAAHQDWCDDVNGPYGAGEHGSEATRRDQTWEELQDVEEQIRVELQREAEGEP